MVEDALDPAADDVSVFGATGTGTKTVGVENVDAIDLELIAPAGGNDNVEPGGRVFVESADVSGMATIELAIADNIGNGLFSSADGGGVVAALTDVTTFVDSDGQDGFIAAADGGGGDGTDTGGRRGGGDEDGSPIAVGFGGETTIAESERGAGAGQVAPAHAPAIDGTGYPTISTPVDQIGAGDRPSDWTPADSNNAPTAELSDTWDPAQHTIGVGKGRSANSADGEIRIRSQGVLDVRILSTNSPVGVGEEVEVEVEVSSGSLSPAEGEITLEIDEGA